MREAALHQQLNSYTFVGKPSQFPNTPHHEAMQSKFSSEVPARHWSVQQVAAWVSVLGDGLAQYAERFREQEINGDVLVKLEDSALQNIIGMSAYGHRCVCTCMCVHVRFNS